MNYATDPILMTDAELSLYLEKLGIMEKPSPTLEGLSQIQLAHMIHIPYENLDSLAGKITSLNRQEMFKKMILGKRGGICFELNGLYAWLLEALGFSFKNHAARFIFDNDIYQMRRHRVMTVNIDGKRYLTDVGINSESARIPLLLEENTIQSDGISEYRFTRDDYWGWLLWHRLTGHQWKRQFGFTEEPQTDMDYVMPCIYCDLHPTSPINKFEKISIFTEDADIRIWDGHYQVYRNGVKEINRLLDEAEKKYILQKEFGIEIEDM